MTEWLEVRRGNAPVIVSLPHTGTGFPSELQEAFASPWLARKDTDWWVDILYSFTRNLDVTTVCTRLSRSVIDCNRDPSGVSLYPGQATTGLCPTETFDGEPLYAKAAPDQVEIDRRRASYFDPYHNALAAEIARLRSHYDSIVLYDAHSIRSRIPRLFESELPQFNIGTNDGATCDAGLAHSIEALCALSGQSFVLNGRFKGGWTTRHYGRPTAGIHAIQMELAQRGYMTEPDPPTVKNWPTPISPYPKVGDVLQSILETCVKFAKEGP
jgi:formiminoglutamase